MNQFGVLFIRIFAKTHIFSSDSIIGFLVIMSNASQDTLQTQQSIEAKGFSMK